MDLSLLIYTVVGALLSSVIILYILENRYQLSSLAKRLTTIEDAISRLVELKGGKQKIQAQQQPHHYNLQPVTSMQIQQKYDAIVAKNNSLVCVGLDTDHDKIPAHIKSLPNPLFEFNKAIIDATHDVVCAYKPNSAFYEAFGDEGVKQLKMTFDYLKQTYPEIVTILDAKRADIGNTNEGYVKFTYEYLQADAVTLHPYLGKEALQPFLDRADKGSIILCRTSNPGAGEFQDLTVDGKPLYVRVAEQISKNWNTHNNCLLVLGATYPDELAQVRAVTGDMIFLVPGIGKQGGDVEKTVRAGMNSKKDGMIINSSRGIIFASQGQDFATRAREEAVKLRDEINTYRTM